MPIKDIVTIVLRLFAVSWFLQGCVVLLEFLNEFGPGGSDSRAYWNFMTPGGILVGAVMLFMWSHNLARFVTPRSSSNIALGTLSQYDLYSFAFAFLGLYFFLSSIADALNWLHYFLRVASETEENDPKRNYDFYQLSRPLLTVLAGGVFLLKAPMCARKMIRMQGKFDTP